MKTSQDNEVNAIFANGLDFEQVVSTDVYKNGDMMVIGFKDGNIQRYDVKNKSSIFVCKVKGLLLVAVSGDGKRVASTSPEGVCVSDTTGDAGTLIQSWSVSPGSSDVTAVGMCSDGTRIVIGTRDGTLYVRNVESGDLKHTLKHTAGSESITICRFCPSGRHIVSGTSDGWLSTWDLGGNKVMTHFPAHTTKIVSVDFLDGKVNSSDANAMVCIWDANNGKLLKAYTHNGSGQLSTMNCKEYLDRIKLFVQWRSIVKQRMEDRRLQLEEVVIQHNRTNSISQIYLSI